MMKHSSQPTSEADDVSVRLYLRDARRVFACIRRRKRAQDALESLQLSDEVTVDRLKVVRGPNDTRWGSQFTSLQSVVVLREYLLQLQGKLDYP